MAEMSVSTALLIGFGLGMLAGITLMLVIKAWRE